MTDISGDPDRENAEVASHDGCDSLGSILAVCTGERKVRYVCASA